MMHHRRDAGPACGEHGIHMRIVNVGMHDIDALRAQPACEAKHGQQIETLATHEREMMNGQALARRLLSHHAEFSEADDFRRGTGW